MVSHGIQLSTKTLGRPIRECRHRLNWTQERLDGAAGVNLRAIQRAEGGHGISSENLGSIAAALGLDESQLRTQAVSHSAVNSL
jgi:transcriptional regulator with XRE-family HTH domain